MTPDNEHEDGPASPVAVRGRALGSRYRLVSRIDAGAMGEVWRAEDRTTGTPVAAKLLRRDFLQDTEIISRFVQERSILMGLKHPHIVRVHDLVVEGDDLAIVMDLVEGPSLGRHLREVGTLPAAQAVAVTTAVLDALVEAHAAHCLHRDVKPDNVLLTTVDPLDADAVRLTDFSIARLAQATSVQATGLLGTPGYMPPELFAEGRFSAASDVYATGVLLYELLAGRTPFAGPGTAHTMGFRHVTSEPPPLPVDDDLWRVVATMLSKDPTLRLTAAGSADALRALDPATLSAPALPRQSDPGSWTTTGTGATTGGGAGPIRVDVARADLDVGATNLKGAVTEPSLLARPGEAGALTPGGAGTDLGVTRLGGAVTDYRRPVLEPAVVSEEKATRPRWVLWAGALGGTVAVALVVVLAVNLLGGSDDEDGALGATPGSPLQGTVTSSADAAQAASGLDVTYDATYDAERGAVDLEVAYASDDSVLRGPFLVTLPVAEDATACPPVVWEGTEVTPNIPESTGVSASCSFVVDAGVVDPGAEVGVVGTIETELAEEDAQAELDAFVDGLDTSTAAALDKVSFGDAFAAQRLVGLELRLPGAVQRTAEDQTLEVDVLGVYGSYTYRDNPILSSPVSGPATSVLDTVAGGYAGVSFEVCDALTLDDLDIGIRGFTDDCRLAVDVGDLETETTFTISDAGG